MFAMTGRRYLLLALNIVKGEDREHYSWLVSTA
jgi:hypothetical protein